jgi:hypothetical protein
MPRALQVSRNDKNCGKPNWRSDLPIKKIAAVESTRFHLLEGNVLKIQHDKE